MNFRYKIAAAFPAVALLLLAAACAGSEPIVASTGAISPSEQRDAMQERLHSVIQNELDSEQRH